MYCKKENCLNTPIVKGKYCSMHRCRGKRCSEDGCEKLAQGKTEKCKSHGGGKRCNENGCDKLAQGKTEKCKSHGGGKRCNEDGCDKLAQGKTEKCKAHGGGKRCNEDGCTKSAQGKNKCKAHGGGKRCNEDGCTKSAQGGYDKCKEHGGGKRCKENGCTKSAQEGYDKCKEHGGGKLCNKNNCKNLSRHNSEYCKKHGGGKRCKEDGCTKSAIDGYEKCKEHGGGKLCPNCIDWIDSRIGSNKYDGYCATCFKRIYPEDHRSKIIYTHTKEIRVRNAISEKSITNKKFEGFIHDKSIYTKNCDCTNRRRIDHCKLVGNTMLAIETDEFAHKNYDKKDEEIRYDDLYMVYSGKWIYIRFNPDDIFSQKIDIEDRITILLEVIEKQIDRIEQEENEELVDIIKLFY